MDDWKSYASSLEGREKSALKLYTKEHDSAKKYNDLRNSIVDGTTRAGATIAEVLENAPPTETDMVLYRGFVTNEQMGEFVDLRCTNSEDHKPFSFTTSLDVAKNFYGYTAFGGILVLFVPAGTRYLVSVTSVSESPNEEEVIVGPKLTLKKLAKKPDGVKRPNVVDMDNNPAKITYLAVCGTLEEGEDRASEEEEGEEEEGE